MDTRDELVTAVDAAFADTARGHDPWADPHPDRRPRDDEYSRVSDGEKWRILGARVEAWIVALTAAGRATVERDVTARWQVEPGTIITRVDRLVPTRRGALAITIGHSRVGEVDAAGITLGVGDPAVCIGWLPDCGCDACDCGSQNELDHLDRHLLGVVIGAFRLLTRGDRRITVLDGDGWSASGRFGRGDVEAVLAEPAGWHELSGPAW